MESIYSDYNLAKESEKSNPQKSIGLYNTLISLDCLEFLLIFFKRRSKY